MLDLFEGEGVRHRPGISLNTGGGMAYLGELPPVSSRQEDENEKQDKPKQPMFVCGTHVATALLQNLRSRFSSKTLK
jgi:hypothetical protein